MTNKFFNDAIIGNKKLIATFSKTGELLRMIYPGADFRQFIDYFKTGVKINDSDLVNLNDDINNHYSQKYMEDTNILVTKIENTYFNLEIEQVDFVSIKENLLMKQYTFTNHHSIDLDIHLLVHSKLHSDLNNKVGGMELNQALIQYCHDYRFAIFSKNPMESYQINESDSNISSGEIGGKDYIGMSTDSSIKYKVGVLKPGESKTISIFVSVNEYKDKEKIDQLEQEITEFRKLDVKKELGTAKRYWNKYVEEHKGNFSLKEVNTEYTKKIQKIYHRSILLYALLINDTTGGISAAIESDDRMEQSGGYAYCWPRDAIYICGALDKLKMEKQTDKFYKNFCKMTQSKNGMWEQRFYTDGRLAPCWGLQIDETSSVVYGVMEHYQHTKDEKFLKDMLRTCENAIHFLKKYVAQICNIQEESDVVKKEIEEYYKDRKEKIPDSYDLWEMEEGVHLYSLASIYGAFEAIIKIYQVLAPSYESNRLKLEAMKKEERSLEKYQEEIKKYIQNNLYNEHTKVLKRNTKDEKSDISTLGVVVPFELFSPKEKKVLNTVEKMNMTLRTYTGGYLRFESDHYMGGKNPWPIATLWMAMYYQKVGNRKAAEECIKFVVDTASDLGFLAEQVDNETKKGTWINGLGWSHAMFVLLFSK